MQVCIFTAAECYETGAGYEAGAGYELEALPRRFKYQMRERSEMRRNPSAAPPITSSSGSRITRPAHAVSALAVSLFSKDP